MNTTHKNNYKRHVVEGCNHTTALKTSNLCLKLLLLLIIFLHVESYGLDPIREQKCPEKLIYSCPERVFEQFYRPSTDTSSVNENYLYNLFHVNGRYMVTSNPLSQEYLLSTFGKLNIINDTIIFTPEISIYSDKKSDNILNIRHIENLEEEQKYEQELKMKGVRDGETRIVLFIDMRQKVSPQEWTYEKTIYKLSSNYSILSDSINKNDVINSTL